MLFDEVKAPSVDHILKHYKRLQSGVSTSVFENVAQGSMAIHEGITLAASWSFSDGRHCSMTSPRLWRSGEAVGCC